MAEYIDKSKLETHEICEHGEWVEVVYMDDIREEPTIDIVRCKDCKKHSSENELHEVFCEAYEVVKSENGHCDLGERMDEVKK